MVEHHVGASEQAVSEVCEEVLILVADLLGMTVERQQGAILLWFRRLLLPACSSHSFGVEFRGWKS